MRSSGSILIIVLWVSIILSILAIGLAQRVSSGLKITQVCQDRLKAFYLAKAAVVRSIAELKRDKNDYDALNESWSSNPEIFKEVSLGDGNWTLSYFYNESKDSIFYGMVDEERKININTASHEILRRLPHMTDEAVDSIIDWRDADDTPQLNGAENAYYQSLDLPYNCKNGAFEVLEELLLVKGMTPQILSDIRDLITVYTEGKININTASREVLLALGLDEELADRIIRYRAGEDKQEGTDDDKVFKNIANIQEDLENFEMLTQEESLQMANLVNNNDITVRSDNFRLNVVAALYNKNLTREISAIVNRQGKITYWQED